MQILVESGEAEEWRNSENRDYQEHLAGEKRDQQAQREEKKDKREKRHEYARLLIGATLGFILGKIL